MSNFESSLVGRKINAIPPGIIHHKELPDGMFTYKIHTVWLDEDGLPVCQAELINGEIGEFPPPPDQVQVYVLLLGTHWNLLEEEE